MILDKIQKNSFKYLENVKQVNLSPLKKDDPTDMSSTYLYDNIRSMFINDRCKPYDIYAREGRFPKHIQNPVNTELFVDRKSDTLLVIIGESWSYCDNIIKAVHSPKGMDAPAYRTEFSFWGHLARALQADILVSTVPGNCNPNMLTSFVDLKNNILSNHSYEKVYILFQITSPGRDNSEYEQIEWNKIPIFTASKLYEGLETQEASKYSFRSWLEEYDNAILKQLSTTVSDIKNSEIFVWKNFTRWNYTKKPSNINIVPIVWSEHTCYTHGIKVPMPDSLEQTELFTLFQKLRITKAKSLKIKLLDDQEHLYDFWKDCSLSRPHPSPLAHFSWFEYLLFATGMYKAIEGESGEHIHS